MKPLKRKTFGKILAFNAAVSLTAGFVLAAAVTVCTGRIMQNKAECTSIEGYNSLQHSLMLNDEPEMTPVQQKRFYQMKLAWATNYYNEISSVNFNSLESAYVLYDYENKNILADSERAIFLKAIGPKIYEFSADEDRKELIPWLMLLDENGDTPEFADDYEWRVYISDDGISEEIYSYLDTEKSKEKNFPVFNEFYINMDDCTFYPGKFEVYTPDNYNRKKICDAEIKPQNLQKYEYKRAGDIRANCMMIGNSPDSDELNIARYHAGMLNKSEYITGEVRDFSLFGLREGAMRNIQEITIDGHRYFLIGMYGYDFWAGYGKYLYIMYVIILVICIVSTYVISSLKFSKLKAEYFAEDYRRQMTDTLAHDLKSPLMAVSGYAENLKTGISPEKNEHYIDSILQNVEYMDGIIKNVLELSKLEKNTDPKERKQTALHSLTDELLKKYAAKTEERNINVSVRGEMCIQADTELISHALENLISNAVKYTPENGSVDILFEKDRFIFENGFDGVFNISPEELWKPFVRGDEIRTGKKGSGLGLSIVKNILEQHDFSVKIDVADGKFKVIAEKHK